MRSGKLDSSLALVLATVGIGAGVGAWVWHANNGAKEPPPAQGTGRGTDVQRPEAASPLAGGEALANTFLPGASAEYELTLIHTMGSLRAGPWRLLLERTADGPGIAFTQTVKTSSGEVVHTSRHTLDSGAGVWEQLFPFVSALHWPKDFEEARRKGAVFEGDAFFCSTAGPVIRLRPSASRDYELEGRTLRCEVHEGRMEPRAIRKSRDGKHIVGYPSYYDVQIWRHPDAPLGLAAFRLTNDEDGPIAVQVRLVRGAGRAPTGKLVSLEFTSDPNLLREGDRLSAAGARFPEVEWDPGAGINAPITHDRNAKVAVRLKLTVERIPADSDFTLTGTSTEPALRFASAGKLSTGETILQLVGRSSLGPKIRQLSAPIQWSMRVAGKTIDLGRTGPHEIHILWASPARVPGIGSGLKNSLGMVNHLTHPRVKLLTDSRIAGGKEDLHTIACAVQSHVNASMTWGLRTIDVNSTNGDPYWALLERTGRGQCGEAAMLMEMMLRLLGIEARHKHVLGVSKRELVEKGEHISYAGHVRGRECRFCKVHGPEELWLNFSKSPGRYVWNEGEGCVEVEGRLYGGFSNVIGSRWRTRTAAQDILLQLEQEFGARNGGRFQVWAHEDGPCCLEAGQSGGGDPFPRVPPP